MEFNNFYTYILEFGKSDRLHEVCHEHFHDRLRVRQDNMTE